METRLRLSQLSLETGERGLDLVQTQIICLSDTAGRCLESRRLVAFAASQLEKKKKEKPETICPTCRFLVLGSKKKTRQTCSSNVAFLLRGPGFAGSTVLAFHAKRYAEQREG